LDEFLVRATCKILFKHPGFSLAKLLSASIGGLNCLVFLGGLGGFNMIFSAPWRLGG
jgi:hypothetical protein